MSPEQVFQRCTEARAAAPNIRCIVDLQGNKLRVGDIAERQLDLGERVVLAEDPLERGAVIVPHPELFAQIMVGEHLTLDDARIQIRVVERNTASLVAEVLRAGRLRPRKGINRVEHPLQLDELSVRDQTTISRCLALEGIDFAFSFAADGSEGQWLRRLAPGRRVILKVERREAIDNLACLAQSADELWICRGDLGAQLGLFEMASVIARLEPRRFSVPLLMAGQVFEHLTHHDVPTRSEVCHLYDLIARGYSGIVLSDETAVGVAPESAAAWAAQLMQQAAAHC